MSIPRILVVEDDVHTRKLMRALLKQAGFEVEVACNGKETLEMLDRARFDLLVTNIMMPGKEGFFCIYLFCRMETEVFARYPCDALRFAALGHQLLEVQIA